MRKSRCTEPNTVGPSAKRAAIALLRGVVESEARASRVLRARIAPAAAHCCRCVYLSAANLTRELTLAHLAFDLLPEVRCAS